MNKQALLAVGIVALIVVVWNVAFAGPRVPEDSKEVINQERSAPTTLYTPAQLAEHKAEGSCWIALGGNVYDATPLIPIHEAGLKLVPLCGTDATVAFSELPIATQESLKNALYGGYRIGVYAN